MFLAGIFLGGFIGLIAGWVICDSNENGDRTTAMVVALAVAILFFVVLIFGHYEGWFDMAEEAIEVVDMLP